MTPIRTLLILGLMTGSLLSGCGVFPQLGPPEERPLREAQQEYASAKTDSQLKSDPAAQEKLAQARKTYEDTALAAATQRRDQGELFQAQQILDAAIQEMPDSQALLDARQTIEIRRTNLLRINDCRLGAARADYLMNKAELLQVRAPLETRDYMQDWQVRREREEVELLAAQLRDCAIQALNDRHLGLADDTLAAARRIHGEEFVAEELRRLAQLKNPQPRPRRDGAETKKAAPKQVSAEVTPQQKIRTARTRLQSAMTRGDLREAKELLTELRRLEGETPQLVELDRAVSEAIAAYIADTHEQANTLYRDRQIVQARDLWQKILELDPEDTQARANLERAERVLKKLEELQGLSAEPPVVPAEPVPPPASP
jgi:tetratricopeptide (TPR) repeat protein